jgi:hypothetical protein
VESMKEAPLPFRPSYDLMSMARNRSSSPEWGPIIDVLSKERWLQSRERLLECFSALMHAVNVGTETLIGLCPWANGGENSPNLVIFRSRTREAWRLARSSRVVPSRVGLAMKLLVLASNSEIRQ